MSWVSEKVIKLINKNYYSGIYELFELCSVWEFLFSKELSSNSEPYRILVEEKKVTLFIRVKPYYLMEITKKRDNILAVVNRYFLCSFITDLCYLPLIS